MKELFQEKEIYTLAGQKKIISLSSDFISSVIFCQLLISLNILWQYRLFLPAIAAYFSANSGLSPSRTAERNAAAAVSPAPEALIILERFSMICIAPKFLIIPVFIIKTRYKVLIH